MDEGMILAVGLALGIALTAWVIHGNYEDYTIDAAWCPRYLEAADTVQVLQEFPQCVEFING